MVGGIPSGLGGCSSLSELKLFDNKLGGTIPPVLGNFDSLGA